MLKKRWAKVLVFVAGLVPIFWLCWRAWNQNLTANPIEFITRYTGDWTLRFIVFALAVTPLRKLLGLPDLIRFRRMIGLYAFFYGTLHFITYIWLDKFFDLAEMLKDIAKRPFITVGFTAFVLMIPLAVTSTAGWIRRLGGTCGSVRAFALYPHVVVWRRSLRSGDFCRCRLWFCLSGPGLVLPGLRLWSTRLRFCLGRTRFCLSRFRGKIGQLFFQLRNSAILNFACLAQFTAALRAF